MTTREDCIFCRIIAGEIPAERVYESESVIVFRDISPQAPHHMLAIPKEHLTTLAELAGWECEIFEAAAAVAAKNGIDRTGYRVVLNQGADAGQAVAHLHFHILGGREMSWPPG